LPPPPSRIAIIGGGLAGLAAAVGLADRGLHIELLETRRQLGGRAGSFRDPASGELVDHCQHVSLGCCTNLDDFCRRTGLMHLLNRQRTLHFFGPDNRRYDVCASRWLPAPLHLLPSLLRLRYLSWRERIRIIRALRQLARTDKNTITINQWLRDRGQTDRAIELFWAPVIVSALSETPDRAAVPPARKVFVDAFLGQRHAYEMQTPRVPLGELYGNQLEQWLSQHGVTVRRECGVKQLLGDAAGVKNLLLDDGQQQPIDAVIVAVPWRRLSELLSDPLRAPLPELREIGRFQSAPITAVHLWFDRPITELPHAVLPGRVCQWIFRHGPQYYQVVISASRNLGPTSRDDLIKVVQGELASIWPAAVEAKLLQARVVTEQYAVFSPLPGAEQLRPTQKTSVPNLFLAGDWTATGWPATMEGAVRSGYLAAEALLDLFGQSAKLLAPDLPRPRLARWLGL
jgi:squalene-associated FAD-dependent desaturase